MNDIMISIVLFAGEEFVCMNRGGVGCSAVFISLSEETAELVLRWKANGNLFTIN